MPAVVRRRLDASQFRLGIIALTDATMDALSLGASVLVIDKSHNAVETGNWKTIQERPSECVERLRLMHRNPVKRGLGLESPKSGPRAAIGTTPMENREVLINDEQKV
ncbi:MAG: hypothetical protein WAN65_09595 [Candidatus Sulfotelmatobacter sp.]